MRIDGYPVPVYLVCPNARFMDDVEHQPTTMLDDEIGSGPPRRRLLCLCGKVVTEANAKRLDSY
jgi:hypothetical protein